MKTFYKVNLILNAAFSLFFLFCGILALLNLNGNPIEGIVVSNALIFISLIFLLFSFVCNKIYNCNLQQKIINKKLIIGGRFLFVFNIICAIAIFLCAFAAFISFSEFTTKSMQRQLPFFTVFIILMLLCGLTALVNLFFYINSVKKNKLVISEIINTIGH